MNRSFSRSDWLSIKIVQARVDRILEDVGSSRQSCNSCLFGKVISGGNKSMIKNIDKITAQLLVPDKAN